MSLSLNPNIWGPDQWTVLYETCFCLEMCRHLKNAKGMTLLKRFLYILSDLFLCDHCGEFFTRQLVLSSEETNYIDWIYDLKNLVTLKIFVTNQETKKCTLQVCPLITLSRLEFYDRLLYHHKTPSYKSWLFTISLIIKKYEHENKARNEETNNNSRDTRLDDLKSTLQEIKQHISYFKNMPTSLFDTDNDSVNNFFENYLKAATIS